MRACTPKGAAMERFNGRIEDVLQSHHFRSGEELETTLHRYLWLYNQHLPQSALGSKSPSQAMKHRHKLKPELFKKQPYYHLGCYKSLIAQRPGHFGNTRLVTNVTHKEAVNQTAPSMHQSVPAANSVAM
jgi:hypothetical protein